MTHVFNDPKEEIPADEEETEEDRGDYEEIENELNSSIYPD